MDAARLTDERLRFGLNSDQASRERMCLGVLALDRSYSDIHPRRPEGGPDGSRDIECKRLSEKCFGAIGFKNNVSDSPKDKRDIKNKFKADIKAARSVDIAVKSFVFFCNVDLSPAENEKLKQYGESHGFSHVDIYWRERLRHTLDGVEGLSLRFQYLGIEMSIAEQASFFARYGKDLEDLLHGRFDRIEQILDELEFSRWKAGYISRLELELKFKNQIDSQQAKPEHFRVALELQGNAGEHRSIILGCCDDFWPTNDGRFYFGTKPFFWRERHGTIDDSWVPLGTRVGGGVISGIRINLEWRPVCEVMVSEFEWLSSHLHFSENLADRLDSAKFTIDNHIIFECKLPTEKIKPAKPSLGWPNELTEEERKKRWMYVDCGFITLNRNPRKLH